MCVCMFRETETEFRTEVQNRNLQNKESVRYINIISITDFKSGVYMY